MWEYVLDFWSNTDLLSAKVKVIYSLNGAESFLKSQPVLQLVKKFPAFYGTRTFITAFTSARFLSLSWANSIQSTPLHPTSWKSILILSSHLRLGLPSGLFPSSFPTKTLYTPLLSPIRVTCPPITFFSILSYGQYWARRTDHSAPHYAVSCTPLLPRPS